MIQIMMDSAEDVFNRIFRDCRKETDYTFFYPDSAEGITSLKVDGGKLEGNFTLLRRILAEQEQFARVSLVFHEEILRLLFPSYLYGFVEDTFARAIHHKIEGCGYAYRECVTRRTINIREYDQLFTRIIHEDRNAAMEIALSRLLVPTGLSQEHKERYERYLECLGMEAMRFILGFSEKSPSYSGDSIEAVSYLLENCLLSKEAAEEAFMSCDSTKYAEVAAMLHQYMNLHWRRAKSVFVLEDF